MCNHTHLIVQSEEGKLSDLILDFKKFIPLINSLGNCSNNSWITIMIFDYFTDDNDHSGVQLEHCGTLLMADLLLELKFPQQYWLNKFLGQI